MVRETNPAGGRSASSGAGRGRPRRNAFLATSFGRVVGGKGSGAHVIDEVLHQMGTLLVHRLADGRALEHPVDGQRDHLVDHRVGDLPVGRLGEVGRLLLAAASEGGEALELLPASGLGAGHLARQEPPQPPTPGHLGVLECLGRVAHALVEHGRAAGKTAFGLEEQAHEGLPQERALVGRMPGGYSSLAVSRPRNRPSPVPSRADRPKKGIRLGLARATQLTKPPPFATIDPAGVRGGRPTDPGGSA